MSSWFGFGSSSSTKASPKKGKGKRSSAGSKGGDGSGGQDDSEAPSSGSSLKVSVTQTADARRRRADEGAIFTSTCCPPGPGLENACELPFGFVWTPMAICNEKIVGEDSSDDDEEVENEDGTKDPVCHVIKCEDQSLPPVLCLSCLTYLNPFCEMDYETGIWICPLCEHENVVPMEELEDEDSPVRTALSSFMVEYRQPSESLNSPDDDEEEDEGYDVDYCTYVLVVDKNLDPSDAHAIAPAVEDFIQEAPEGQKVRIGLVLFDKDVSTYQLGISSGLASADMFTLDDPSTVEGEDSDEALEKRSYLLNVEEGTETLRTCLSAIFGVEVEENKNGSRSSDHTLSVLSRLDMLRSRKDARIRKEQFGTNKENDSSQNQPAESPWVKYRKESKKGHPVRCTGEAIQAALDLAGMNLSTPSRTSRIVLFTNGCPNAGEGTVVSQTTSGKTSKKKSVHDVVDADLLQKSIEYYDTLANFAVSSGIGFDVFCAGSNELALPAYQALVEPGGGYVIPQLSFKVDLSRNLRFVLTTTFMSRSRNIPEEVEDGTGGAECILDIRTDGFISPTQLCGSGEVLPGDAARMVENERSAFAAGAALAAEKGIKTNKLPSTEALEMSLTRLQVGRVDPLSTFAVLLEVDDSLAEEDEFAFFQMVVRHISRTGREEITRVCSFKLPVADDVNDYISGVDDEVVSVMLAKSAVYRALHGREETDETRDITASGDANAQEKLAYDTQLDLDATVQRISGAFRLLGLENKVQSLSISKSRSKKKGKAETSIETAFPPELKGTLSRLYHLRRGPLISPGPMRSMDDRAEMRVLFLRFPLEDCLLMMKGSVWSSGVVGGIMSSWDVMLDFPPETLALWDSSILAADFHDTLFVWTGKNCSAGRYDGIRNKFKEFIQDRSTDRFPVPSLHMLNDGDSMCRRLTTRLAPSHSDSKEHQLLHFPALSTLKPEELSALRSKFRFYDAEADASFKRWFWSVSSASNVSREDGRSLCE